MDLKYINDNKGEFINGGGTGSVYEMGKDLVYKEFHEPQPLFHMHLYKKLTKYKNHKNVYFPIDFASDGHYLYGYICKKAPGDLLYYSMPTIDLDTLSKTSDEIEDVIGSISRDKIIMYDVHDANILFDGKKQMLIDPDEYVEAFPNVPSKRIMKDNISRYRESIVDLLYLNFSTIKNKTSQYILEHLLSQNISISAMTSEIKEIIFRQYKKEPKTMQEIQKLLIK